MKSGPDSGSLDSSTWGNLRSEYCSHAPLFSCRNRPVLPDLGMISQRSDVQFIFPVQIEYQQVGFTRIEINIVINNISVHSLQSFFEVLDQLFGFARRNIVFTFNGYCSFSTVYSVMFYTCNLDESLTIDVESFLSKVVSSAAIYKYKQLLSRKFSYVKAIFQRRYKIYLKCNIRKNYPYITQKVRGEAEDRK